MTNKTPPGGGGGLFKISTCSLDSVQSPFDFTPPPLLQQCNRICIKIAPRCSARTAKRGSHGKGKSSRREECVYKYCR